MKNRCLKFATLIIFVCFGLTSTLPVRALAGPGFMFGPGKGPGEGPGSGAVKGPGGGPGSGPVKGPGSGPRGGSVKGPGSGPRGGSVKGPGSGPRGGSVKGPGSGPRGGQVKGPRGGPGNGFRGGPGMGPGVGPGSVPGFRGIPVPGFRNPPPGGQVVRHKGYDYSFNNGRCYRHGPNGYFGVRPPIGIIAYNLPAAAVAMLIGGFTYYVYDNVYYRKVPAGYQVVQVPTRTTQPPPAATLNPAVVGSQVVVTAKTLNVRSGPGTNHAVLTRTYMGSILIVQGSAHNWYYVQLPDNTSGWVMKTLVSVPDNGPQG